MKYDQIFWPILTALIVSAQFPGKQKSETVTAYFDDGKRTLYHADPVTQTVSAFAFQAEGKPAAIDPFGITIHGCNVGDFQNWTCPSVTTSDRDAGIQYVPVAKYGFIQAIDGDVSVTDPKMLIPPISWFRWELGKAARQFGKKG